MLPLLRPVRPLMLSNHVLPSRSFLSPPSASSLLPMPLPSPRETHFWFIRPDDVTNSCLLDKYQDLLSSQERENVLRMSGEELQKNSILARALVRTTISRYTNCEISPRSLKFRKNIFGKPEVEWPGDYASSPSLHFSLSHTPSLIACGLAVDKAVGVDVEEKHRQLRSSVLSFAKRFFTPKEVHFLHAFSDSEIQKQELIKIWTLKEAYVKALGRGFSAAPFKDFGISYLPLKDGKECSVLSEDASEIIVEPSVDSDFLTTDWDFALFEVSNSHYAAVCMGKDEGSQCEVKNLPRLKVWRTIPFVEDICVSQTDEVLPISGFS